jgi:hypothetical protein
MCWNLKCLKQRADNSVTAMEPETIQKTGRVRKARRVGKIF